MLIKRHLLKDPRTEKVETVFEYPPDLASPTIRPNKDCTLVTRELMRIPILVVPNEYLIQGDGYELDDAMYASFEFLNIHTADAKEKADDAEYNKRVGKVQELFAVGTLHKRSCKTMFFTGPKPVYKQTFTDNWVWREQGILALENRGHFRTIESLSLKGLNDVFITGTFECGDVVMADTQCKITISVGQSKESVNAWMT